jgi:hypothetical protein
VRRSCLLSLVLTLCVVPAADAKRKHRCAIRDGVVVLHDKKAVILSRDVAYSDLEDATEYYGCLRSKRRPFFIASASSDQYGSSQIGPIVLRGGYFAYVESVGLIDGSCRSSVTVYSLRKRSEDYASAAGADGQTGMCPSAGNLLLTSTGLAAWVGSQGGQRFIRKLDHAGQGTLDSGDVDPNSLTLSQAGAVAWTHAGERRTAQLH